MTTTRRRLMALSLFWGLSARVARADRHGEAATLDGSGLLHGSAEAGAVAIHLPTEGARVLARLALADQKLVVAAFAATLQMGSRAELAALIGSDGGHPRVLGVELLTWRSPGGASLSSRLSATSDGTRLRIERVAARPRPDLPPTHEVWIDYLAWRPDAPLADSPVHPPLPGSCQSALAVTRARVKAALAAPCREIDLAWLSGAGLLAPPF